MQSQDVRDITRYHEQRSQGGAASITNVSQVVARYPEMSQRVPNRSYGFGLLQQHFRLVCLSGGSYFDLHDSVGPLNCYSDLESGVDTKCAHCTIDLIMIK